MKIPSNGRTPQPERLPERPKSNDQLAQRIWGKDFSELTPAAPRGKPGKPTNPSAHGKLALQPPKHASKKGLDGVKAAHTATKALKGEKVSAMPTKKELLQTTRLIAQTIQEGSIAPKIRRH